MTLLAPKLRRHQVRTILFILLGLRYALGERKFIERAIGHSLRHFVVAAVLLSLGIFAAIIFASI